MSAIGFQSVSIAQPSMLAGDRAALNQAVRTGEGVAVVISRWLKPLIPANYRSVQATDVAAGLVQAVQTGKLGIQRIPSGRLQGAASRR